MHKSVERRIVTRLAADATWAKSRVGQLARRLVDYEVPIDTAASFVGVKPLVLRRWLYGYGKGHNPTIYAPGGAPSLRTAREARIDRLIQFIDSIGWTRGLHDRWDITLDYLDNVSPDHDS